MEYEAGDVIWYQHFGGGLRQVRVDECLADVKHGRPGFSGVVVSGPEKGNAVWGYDSQIIPCGWRRSAASCDRSERSTLES